MFPIIGKSGFYFSNHWKGVRTGFSRGFDPGETARSDILLHPSLLPLLPPVQIVRARGNSGNEARASDDVLNYETHEDHERIPQRSTAVPAVPAQRITHRRDACATFSCVAVASSSLYLFFIYFH